MSHCDSFMINIGNADRLSSNDILCCVIYAYCMLTACVMTVSSSYDLFTLTN